MKQSDGPSKGDQQVHITLRPRLIARHRTEQRNALHRLRIQLGTVFGDYPKGGIAVHGYTPRTQCPDFPPSFSSSRTPSMAMPRSTALHMS